jgi:hypothetical protein
MTPSEHKAERDKKLAQASVLVAQALPQHWGSVQFNLQGGKTANVNIVESVKLQEGETR